MAIPARWEESAEFVGSPRQPRRTLRLETQGELASGHATNVLLHNVSTTGLLLESTISLASGETLAIDLPDIGATPAKVIWASGALYGCQFERPVSAAALSAAQLRSAVVEKVDLTPQTGGPREESFAVRLHRLRKERGYSLSRIATQLGVSKPTVWAWEQGTARPVESRIDALAETLGVERAELMVGRKPAGLRELLARSREQIAVLVGTTPDKIRIMIDL
jgi:transcriptional regulator with XRE-family HTH domain